MGMEVRFSNVRKEEPWLSHGTHTVYHTAMHGCLRVLCWRKTCCITVTACFYSSLARISLLCATLPDDMHYAILNTSFRTDCTVQLHNFCMECKMNVSERASIIFEVLLLWFRLF